MKKAQGSIEYLMIIAAILVIAVVVVVVANAFGTQGTSQVSVQDDRYRAAMVGANLIGYSQPFLGNVETAPSAVEYKSARYSVQLMDEQEILDYVSDSINNNGRVDYISYLTGIDKKYYPLFVGVGDMALLSTTAATEEQIKALPKTFSMERDSNQPNSCISIAFGSPCPQIVAQ